MTLTSKLATLASLAVLSSSVVGSPFPTPMHSGNKTSRPLRGPDAYAAAAYLAQLNRQTGHGMAGEYFSSVPVPAQMQSGVHSHGPTRGYRGPLNLNESSANLDALAELDNQDMHGEISPNFLNSRGTGGKKSKSRYRSMKNAPNPVSLEDSFSKVRISEDAHTSSESSSQHESNSDDRPIQSIPVWWSTMKEKRRDSLLKEMMQATKRTEREILTFLSNPRITSDIAKLMIGQDSRDIDSFYHEPDMFIDSLHEGSKGEKQKYPWQDGLRGSERAHVRDLVRTYSQLGPVYCDLYLQKASTGFGSVLLDYEKYDNDGAIQSAVASLQHRKAGAHNSQETSYNAAYSDGLHGDYDTSGQYSAPQEWLANDSYGSMFQAAYSGHAAGYGAQGGGSASHSDNYSNLGYNSQGRMQGGPSGYYESHGYNPQGEWGASSGYGTDQGYNQSNYNYDGSGNSGGWR